MAPPEMVALLKIAADIDYIRDLTSQNAGHMDYVLKVALPRIESSLEDLKLRIDNHITTPESTKSNV